MTYRVCKNAHIMQYRQSHQYTVGAQVLIILNTEFRQEKTLHQSWHCVLEHTSSAGFYQCFAFYAVKMVFFIFSYEATTIFNPELIKVSPRKNTSKQQYALKHNATANWVKGQKTGACYCTLQLHFVTHFRFDSKGQIFSCYSASHWPYYVLSLSLIATLTNCCKPAQGPIGYCEKIMSGRRERTPN